MVLIDWPVIGFDALSLIVSFSIMTILAYCTLRLIDRALPDVDFTIIQNDPKAEAIAGAGWLILYALVFAGSLVAPFSLDSLIVREIIWTVIMLVVMAILTIIAVRFISPYLGYCGKDGLQSLGKDPVASAILYLGLCVLIGMIGYTALVA